MHSKFHCRCRRCGARQTRTRHPETFTPRCRGCGARGTLRVDKWAQGRPWRQNVCSCEAYHFAHRRASGRCIFRVADREAFEERAAIIEFCGGEPRDVAERAAALEQWVAV